MVQKISLSGFYGHRFKDYSNIIEELHFFFVISLMLPIQYSHTTSLYFLIWMLEKLLGIWVSSKSSFKSGDSL